MKRLDSYLRNRLLPFRTVLLSAVSAIALFAALAAPAQLQVVGDGGPGPVKAQHLTAELVSFGSTVAPGSTLQAGLVLTMEEKWHVYWLNAGDSGDPPHIEWTLPSGLTAGPMLFPAPSRLPLGPLMDFGYENTVAFPVLFTATPTMKPGPVHLDAKVTWLVCREVCIPGRAHLGLDLTIAPGGSVVQPAGALAEALTLIPKPLPAGDTLTVLGGKRDFVLTFKAHGSESNAEFYPYDQDQIANSAVQAIEPSPDGVRLRVQRSPLLTQLPASLHGVLKLSDTESYEFTSPVIPGEVAAVPTIAGNSSGSGNSSGGLTIITSLALAFLGGIILNLMPCVFPVLFLKGLALVQSSGEARKELRSHGLVYTLGILVSFWIIVGVLLGLRAGGSQAGWGFQLQSPVFIAVLASFLFFFALSLSGLFDLGLSLTSVGGQLAEKPGYTGSFFTGVLATVVATPCTAPLMGAAIGFALAQSAVVTFSIFTALALGLATPYMLLSLNPAWMKILPRPGAWMEVLKQLTAVPLFASAIWLAWVYGNLNTAADSATSSGHGVDQMALLLLCFLVLAIAGWVLGRWPAKWPSAIAAIALVVAALAIPLVHPKQDHLTWTPYSQAALDQARQAGHPVFIDFTAAWCLSCQVNQKLVLHASDIEKQLADHHVTLLIADWTKYDPAITQELASIHRSGVPTYVLYPANQTAAPDVLPELLTKDLVLKAIQRDTK